MTPYAAYRAWHSSVLPLFTRAIASVALARELQSETALVHTRARAVQRRARQLRQARVAQRCQASPTPFSAVSYTFCTSLPVANEVSF